MGGKAIRSVILLFYAVFLISQGCRSGRNISSEKERPVAEDNQLSLVRMLEEKTHDFRTMKIRHIIMDLDMNGIQENIRGNLAMYRDSLIVVSVVPVLGYEFIRILCSPDSVIIINRPEKSYYAASFEYYRKKYSIPVDFKDLQALLANEVFYYKDNLSDRIYEKQLTTRNENNLFIVDAFREGKRITNQGIEIDPEGKRLENVFIVDYDTRMKLNMDYEDFTGGGALLFPKKLKIDLIESNNTIKMDINYGQVIFDDSLKVEFAVPEQYTRGNF